MWSTNLSVGSLLIYPLLFHIRNSGRLDRQIENKLHPNGGCYGCFKNSRRIAAGTGTIGRSDNEPGAIGSWTREAPRASAILDGRSQEARPPRGQQEPV